MKKYNLFALKVTPTNIPAITRERFHVIYSNIAFVLTQKSAEKCLAVIGNAVGVDKTDERLPAYIKEWLCLSEQDIAADELKRKDKTNKFRNDIERDFRAELDKMAQEAGDTT